MKKCTKCGIEKDFSQYHKRKAHPTGYACECKECTKIKYTSEIYKEYRKQYIRDLSPEKRAKDRQIHKNWRERNKEEIAKKGKKYRESNPPIKRNYSESDRQKNRDSYKKHYINNKEAICKRTSDYVKNNKFKVYQRVRNKMKNNPLYALRKKASARIKAAMIRGSFNFTKDTLKFIGCDMVTLKKHIERQFKKGMTWPNNTKQGWHIDHIIPLASAKTEEELIPLFHYTNLQPLWAKENWTKADKILPVQITMTI